LDPGARADKGLALSRAATDVPLNRDTLPSLDEDLSITDGSAETVVTSVESVVEKLESLVRRPELGNRNVRVRVEGDRDGTLVVVAGVDPHRALDGEFAVEVVIASFDGREARVRHDGCVVDL